MIDTIIRAVAIVATLIVGVGFVLFAVDELNGASRHQQAQVTSTEIPASSDQARHGAMRRAIDDADAKLLAPFADVVPSTDRWVAQGVPTLLAFLIYGVGLGFLARYVKSRA